MSSPDVFDRTVQTTNIWLAEIGAELAVNRQASWHALGAVLRTLRDRMPLGLAVHLGAQLPLLVRGAYYERFDPAHVQQAYRTADEFLALVAEDLRGVDDRVSAEDAAEAVFRTLDRHLDAGQLAHVREALPAEIRGLWPERAQTELGSAA